MKIKNIRFKDILSHRKEVLKPIEANNSNLGRVKKIDFKGNIFLDQETTTNTNMIRIKKNDLVISGINADKGAISVYKGDEDILASIHYSSYSFNENEINIDYLKFFLKSDQFKKLLNEQTSGGIKKELKAKHILPLQINLPDLNTQSKIANSINEFELKFESLYKKIYLSYNEIETLSSSVLQEAIEGKLVKFEKNFDPDEILKKLQEEKDNFHKNVKNKLAKKQNSIQDDYKLSVPANWRIIELYDVSKLITDGTHQTPQYVEEGRPFLSAQNVKPFKFMPENHKFITEKAYQENIKNKKPEVGDLLVGRVGNVGQAAVIDKKIEFSYYVSLGLIKLFKNFILSEFLAIVFNSPYGIRYAHKNTSSKGSAAGNFNLGRIRSFKIPITSMEEQMLIVQKVEKLRKKFFLMREKLDKINSDLMSLSRSIYNKYFTESYVEQK